jgi:hypothetical protein
VKRKRVIGIQKDIFLFVEIRLKNLTSLTTAIPSSPMPFPAMSGLWPISMSFLNVSGAPFFNGKNVSVFFRKFEDLYENYNIGDK